jgi:hypothetical protein
MRKAMAKVDEKAIAILERKENCCRLVYINLCRNDKVINLEFCLVENKGLKQQP